mmetsp:Transcript_95877/g.249910  ORF Transcript_95877/g.249910 Transcript_95877/m.249910 type:complete len:313 (+) Transcript_95877:106-1044(+)
MNPLPGVTPERRSLWYGAPGCDDRGRSVDEIRMIKEMCNEEVETFLRVNAIDTAAAKELRCEPPHVALAVLERGPLRACTNPSGALVSRIRDAKRGILQGGGGRFGAPVQTLAALDPNASEAERFLAENKIDQSGAASFRSEAMEVQKFCMAKGPLVNSTNPSASLMARIRTVKMNIQQQANMGLQPGMLPAAGMPALFGSVTGGCAAIGDWAPAPPPMLPPMVLPMVPPASAMHALEDSRTSAAINDDVAKAISRLTSAAQPAFGNGGLPRPTGPVPGAGGPAIQNDEDKRLQDEALKAIQALNAADMAEL